MKKKNCARYLRYSDGPDQTENSITRQREELISFEKR